MRNVLVKEGNLIKKKKKKEDDFDEFKEKQLEWV